jgi:basic membrane lipoprotein Med (substrate-binding protein (PBP1-ABC) superfamily)
MRSENHRLVGVALAVPLAGLLMCLGCATEEPEPPPSFEVRLLTTSPVSGRWEMEAERGLGRIGAELDADVLRLRADNEAERRRLLVSEGRRGTDLVICVGSTFSKTLYLEAGAFPDTSFVMMPGRTGSDNVAGVEFLPEGAGYVAGVLAAHLDEGVTAGVLRGTGGTWLEGLEQGFVRGFSSIRENAEPASATTPAGVLDLAARGVKVALYAVDRAEPDVVAGARTAGLLLVTTDVELIDREPEVVAAAVHVDVAEAMVRLAREVRDGTFAGGPYTFDFGSGVLDVVVNPLLAATADPELREALEVARSEVTAGFVELEKLGM